MYCQRHPNGDVLVVILRKVVFDGPGGAEYEKTFNFAQNKRNAK